MKKILCLLFAITTTVAASSRTVIFEDDFSLETWGEGTNGWVISAHPSHTIEIANLSRNLFFDPIRVNGQTLAIFKNNRTGWEALSYIAREFSTIGYTDITLNLAALQQRGSLWDGPEFLKIEYDLKDGAGYQDLFRERGVFSTPKLTNENEETDSFEAFRGRGTGVVGSTGELSIPWAGSRSSVFVRIWFNSGLVDGTSASEVYFLDRIVISGTPVRR
jgi:hypothetical protein